MPILLGGVFKATNNKSPMEQFAEVKNKKEYFARETERFIQKHAINKYIRNPHFPVNTLHIMRGACYAAGKDFEADYIEIVYQSMWEKGPKMDDPSHHTRGPQRAWSSRRRDYICKPNFRD